MGTGIIICGLNGAGKSTLGKELAKELNLYFIDSEDLYFPKTDDNYIYASPRTHEEAGQLLLCEIKEHKSFVFAAVKGDYGENVLQMYKYAVLVEAPKAVRMQRVRDRSFQKFGDRMLPGGDLYDNEEKFFDIVRSRVENTVEEWIQKLSCPVIRVDGTKSVEKNIELIIEKMQPFNS